MLPGTERRRKYDGTQSFHHRLSSESREKSVTRSTTEEIDFIDTLTKAEIYETSLDGQPDSGKASDAALLLTEKLHRTMSLYSSSTSDSTDLAARHMLAQPQWWSTFGGPFCL